MIELTKEQMKHILQENELKNLLTLDDMDYYVQSKYFLSDECSQNYMMDCDFKHKKIIEIVCQNDQDFLHECCVYLQTLNLETYELYLSDPSHLKLLFQTTSYQITQENHRSFLVYSSTQPQDCINQNIIKLTAKDTELASSFLMEQLPSRPPFQMLFDRFVLAGDGHVNVLLIDGKIVGYVSFYNQTEDIYNIDHIYVVPEMRGHGYATDLIKSYVNDALSNHKLPYYGPAIHEISTKTAMKAGFTLLKEDHLYRISII